MLEEGDLAIGAGGEVAVAALGGDGRVTAEVGVPDEQGFAEAGAGGDEAAVADGGEVGLVQGEDAFGRELGDAVAVGLEIVDEEDVLDVEGPGEVADVEVPGEVGELDALSRTGPGQPKQAATTPWSALGLDGLPASATDALGSSARNLRTTSSRVACSAAGNFWSRTGLSLPPSKL